MGVRRTHRMEVVTSDQECNRIHKALDTEIGQLFDMSIPTWVRSVLITLIGILFIIYAGQWVYNVNTYATKDAVIEVKAEVKDVKDDLRREMNDGFDRVIEAIRKR